MRISPIAHVGANFNRTNAQRVAFGSPYPIDSSMSRDQKSEAQLKQSIEDLLHSKYCDVIMDDFADKRYTPEPYMSKKDAFIEAKGSVRARVSNLVESVFDDYMKNNSDTNDTTEGRWGG